MHVEGQFGAVLFVVKNGEIIYFTDNASTLPDQAREDSGVVVEGIYGTINWVHQGKYRAAQIRMLDDETNYRIPSYQVASGITEGANIHAAGILKENTTYSKGCITIWCEDYVEFLDKANIIDGTPYEKENYPSLSFGQIKKNEEDWQKGEFEKGYFILNRDYMREELIFY